MSLKKLCVVSTITCMLGVSLLAADSPFGGTWKINGAKSKLAGSGMTGNAVVRNEVTADGLKASVEGSDPQGQPMHFSYEATFDGKDGAVTGSPTFDSLAIKRVNARTLTAVGKKDGKVVWTDRRVVAADGKSMTITRNGMSPEGKKYHAIAFLDKQ